ncbi:adenylyltransferase/cytidyltransferase family protein, partial [Curvivirga aplysinae]|uniref:adenylyltransferase/cytidyltransferase family protein n=1 Tax=Curvivirga aplysinae TaxID=2529852 RepID=UPI001C3FE80C
MSHKIIESDQAKEIIGKFPRKDNIVVMCHGTFDLVHPGHIRHLIWAKEHGATLIVSITSDRNVHKGEGRPYVPQDLRAVNLAALEIVDYVIIDHNEEPIENILKIQPDIFVKGYEYSATELNPKTQRELDALTTYGGKFVFSPGDIVYSSTKILHEEKPNISTTKLLT